MTERPTREQVALFVAGAAKELPESIRGQLEAPDPELARRLERMRGLAERAAEALTGPSAGAIARVEALVPDREETRLLVAELIEDTSVLEGVRDEQADGRFLVFRAGDWDLHVRLSPGPDPERVEIRGQLLGPPDADARAEIRVHRDDRRIARGRAGATGEFRLAAVPCPPFRLEVERADGTIRTPVVPAS